MLDSARYRRRVCGPLGLNRGTWVTRASRLSPRREELVGPLQHVSGERAGPLPLRCPSAPALLPESLLSGVAASSGDRHTGQPGSQGCRALSTRTSLFSAPSGFLSSQPKKQRPSGARAAQLGKHKPLPVLSTEEGEAKQTGLQA